MTDKPTITPTENGPLSVEGAHEIMRFPGGESTPMHTKTNLCRCGGSKNKPFCDGTHLRNDFTSAVDASRVPDQLDEYTSGDGRIAIHDNRGLCAHSGRCTDGLAEVFRLRTEPFVDADGATAEEIAAVIDQCPSGALSYTLDGVDHRERGGPPSVGYATGGPYVITGGASLENVNLLDGATGDHCTLCRCGASQNKPFCSGKHWETDFDEDAAN